MYLTVIMVNQNTPRHPMQPFLFYDLDHTNIIESLNHLML